MNSILAYLGGKSLLSKKIIPLIPSHECYCEVFAGAAWMLFKKDESKVEIINDINIDLITLYRVIKHHLEEFLRYFKWILIARDEFERLKQEKPETLTDIQRAARFYYLLRLGYGGEVVNPNFTISPYRKPRLNLIRLEEELSAIHLRLSRVFIENLPYQRIIEKYDRNETFFYLDPPYYNCENYYGKNIFAKEDFGILKEMLTKVNGKFIMSINDVVEIRKLFNDFNIITIDTRYSISNENHKKVTELLIMNYDAKFENNL